MKYKFPIIEKFSDIEHAIDKDYFMVAERQGFTVVNYLFGSPDTFPDIDLNSDCDIAAIRREFRGLIFDDAGKLIRRPFHKFFNVGERSDTQISNIDVSQNHVIYDKLDGSMIAPYIVGFDLIWGTKMGDTDVAKQAEHFVNTSHNGYDSFALESIENGYTPIFEWCSRTQRIVLDYAEDQLILTAARNMRTGEYVSHDALITMGNRFSIPVCPTITSATLSEDFLNDTKKSDAVIEGYVIRFDDGHMAKIKTEWYCDLHRVKSEIAYERGVIKLILNDSMDDLKPLMPEDDLQAIDEYETAFLTALNYTVAKIRELAHCICKAGMSRKDYALNNMRNNPAYVNEIIFKNWDDLLALSADGYKILEQLKLIVLKNCNKNSKFDEFRKTNIFKDVKPWRGVDINE